MENWTFHPEKVSAGLDDYNLDIAVIYKDLSLKEVISIPDNSRINTGVDVFFVHPTILTANIEVPMNVPLSEQPEFNITGTTFFQAGLLAKYGRMFAPRYRQSSGVTYFEPTPLDVQAEVIATSYSDIKAAFQEYLDNYNNGNKIILAGHSQGSFLLSMLLRDVFDDDPSLRSQLVTAALGGIKSVYAIQNDFSGGWWDNIPLCQTQDECGCIHSWVSFKEDQEIPFTNTRSPFFNPLLVEAGLVGRVANLDTDWFLHDESFYSEVGQPLRYYVAPNAFYDLADGYDFIAFDHMYTAKYVREDPIIASLQIGFERELDDERPNDLLAEEFTANFDWWGYHVKDYHIYIWALMEQIDQKLANCP